MRFLVSFCNVGSREDGRVLGIVDSSTGSVSSLSYGRSDVTSACGLAADEEAIYSACLIGETSYLAIFDRRSLMLEEFLPLPPVRDVHSIALDGRAVIAVSTGTDELIRFDPGGRDNTEVIWRATLSGSDQHHLNSLAWHENHLLCMGFGPKSRARWSSADDGYIFDVTNGLYVMRGLYHPHSLVSIGSELAFCESAHGKLRGKQEATFPGYLRGFAYRPDGIRAVATSIARTSGENTVFLNPADPGDRTGRCALYVTSDPASWDHAQIVDLEEHTDEIYDVLPIDAA